VRRFFACLCQKHDDIIAYFEFLCKFPAKIFINEKENGESRRRAAGFFDFCTELPRRKAGSWVFALPLNQIKN
jgi:hypothetical protein